MRLKIGCLRGNLLANTLQFALDETQVLSMVAQFAEERKAHGSKGHPLKRVVRYF